MATTAKRGRWLWSNLMFNPSGRLYPVRPCRCKASTAAPPTWLRGVACLVGAHFAHLEPHRRSGDAFSATKCVCRWATLPPLKRMSPQRSTVAVASGASCSRNRRLIAHSSAPASSGSSSNDVTWRGGDDQVVRRRARVGIVVAVTSSARRGTRSARRWWRLEVLGAEDADARAPPAPPCRRAAPRCARAAGGRDGQLVAHRPESETRGRSRRPAPAVLTQAHASSASAGKNVSPSTSPATSVA